LGRIIWKSPVKDTLVMKKQKYDIFISYRKRSSGDKPEMLQLMLEESGFRRRVSFDKDNLNGRFDVELIRRIDECKDFLMFMVPDTFIKLQPVNAEAVKTGAKAEWDMEEVAFYERIASLVYEEFEAEIKQISRTKDIDFVRIELGRALYRRSKSPEQINIIPIAPQESENYDFATLQLPPDISGLKDYQAVFYSNSRVARFKDIKTDLVKQMQSKPSYLPVKWLIRIPIVLLLIVAGIETYNYYQKMTEQKLAFKHCRTYDDYHNFTKKYPDSSLKEACDSCLHEFNSLRRNGRVCVNNTANIQVKDREKKWINLKWSPAITLSQLRSIVDLMNTMLLIPAKGKEFLMGRVTGKGYDTPQHTVAFSNDYYMCKYEMTRSLWYIIMNDSVVTEDVALPITSVTWSDANTFTGKLRKLTGLDFALPTEAQWEFAAAGGENYRYAGSNDILNVAYYSLNANECLHPVGDKDENGFDLYDMSGNAAEWCTDWMSRYNTDRSTDPSGPSENPGHHKKIIRGGSYLTNERDMDIRHRSAQIYDTAEPHVGFRVVLIKSDNH
jgi:hypothetical protein